MENPDFKKESEGEGAEEVYSKAVRAGRRTYFFDVKATRNDDYYITVTESRKKTGKDGGFTFEKHKIYLYKEDFRKFAEGFQDAVDYVVKSKPECFNPDGTAIVPLRARTNRSTNRNGFGKVAPARAAFFVRNARDGDGARQPVRTEEATGAIPLAARQRRKSR